MHQSIRSSALIVFLFAVLWSIEAKESKRLPACESNECNMSKQHYILYSKVRRAVESKLDIKGDEIYPLLYSIDVLRALSSDLNYDNASKKLISELLANEYLTQSLEVIQSDAGRSLIDLYRTPMNAQEQNLSCNKLRIQDIERASKILAGSKELTNVFANIHNNFVRRSAKKCFKRSCSAIDTAMNRVDYIWGKVRVSQNSGDESSSPETLSNVTRRSTKRNFEIQESELCRFFKRTNETDCQITGRELSEINFVGPDKLDVSDFVASYNSYRNNTMEALGSGPSPGRQQEWSQQVPNILDQCRPIRALLDINLAALRWYGRQELVDKNKHASRSMFCPKLTYWDQLDRLCSELEVTIGGSPNKDTFSY